MCHSQASNGHQNYSGLFLEYTFGFKKHKNNIELRAAPNENLIGYWRTQKPRYPPGNHENRGFQATSLFLSTTFQNITVASLYIVLKLFKLKKYISKEH